MISRARVNYYKDNFGKEFWYVIDDSLHWLREDKALLTVVQY